MGRGVLSWHGLPDDSGWLAPGSPQGRHGACGLATCTSSTRSRRPTGDAVSARFAATQRAAALRTARRTVQVVFVGCCGCAAAGLAPGRGRADGTKVGNAALAANARPRRSTRRSRRSWAKRGDRWRRGCLDGALRGDELPAELRRRDDRLARLLAAKERLAREATERAAAQQAKVDARAAEEAATVSASEIASRPRRRPRWTRRPRRTPPIPTAGS